MTPPAPPQYTKLIKPAATAILAMALAAAIARWSADGKPAWALIKLVLAFALMVALLRERVSVGLALLAGALFFGIAAPLSPAQIGNCFTFGLFAPPQRQLHTLGLKALNLCLMVTLINFLGQAFILTGGITRLITSLERLFRDPRWVLAAVPAFIGLLPMPGGAMLSAPMVGEMGDRHQLTPAQKTLANYWFRHIWEWWWPLFPAILIVLDDAYFGAMVNVLCYMAPFTLAALALGWFFILRRIPRPASPPITESHTRAVVRILRVIWPVLFVVLTILLVRLPDRLDPLLLPAALLAANLGVILIHRMDRRQTRTAIREAVQWKMLLIILTVFILRGVFIMAGSAESLRDTLAGVPPLLVCFLLPFLISVLSGYNLAGVSMAFPLLIPIFTQTGHTGMAVAYAGSFIGILASPVHLCLALTREYYHASWNQVYRGLLPLLAGATALTALIAWLAP